MSNPKDLIGVTKPNLNLVPASAQIIESVVMALGATKYGPFNWRETPVAASVYIAAAQRHLLQWFDGASTDAESGVSHLAHARACLGIMLDAEACGTLIDDRPKPGAAAAMIAAHTTGKPVKAVARAGFQSPPPPPSTTRVFP